MVMHATCGSVESMAIDDMTTAEGRAGQVNRVGHLGTIYPRFAAAARRAKSCPFQKFFPAFFRLNDGADRLGNCGIGRNFAARFFAAGDGAASLPQAGHSNFAVISMAVMPAAGLPQEFEILRQTPVKPLQ
jgi:hypothetical protein